MFITALEYKVLLTAVDTMLEKYSDIYRQACISSDDFDTFICLLNLHNKLIDMQ